MAIKTATCKLFFSCMVIRFYGRKSFMEILLLCRNTMVFFKKYPYILFNYELKSNLYYPIKIRIKFT